MRFTQVMETMGPTPMLGPNVSILPAPQLKYLRFIIFDEAFFIFNNNTIILGGYEVNWLTDYTQLIMNQLSLIPTTLHSHNIITVVVIYYLFQNKIFS